MTPRIGGQKYRRIIDQAPLGICEVDAASGIVTHANPAALQVLGYTPEKFNAPAISDILTEDSRALFGELQENALKGDGSQAEAYEYVIRGQDGREILTRANLMAYVEPANRPSSYFYFQDQTQARRIEKKLWNSQRMEAIGTLAAGIAHGFNNLFMVIQGSVSLLLHKIQSSHPQYHLLTKMDQAAKAGCDITRKLIGYARKGKYHVQPIRLNPLVRDCAALVSRTRINVIVRTELADDLGSFSGDRNQIEQVLLNLFVNAVEAMPMGGQLLIRTRNASAAEAEQRVGRSPTKDHVLLEVSDTGIGMEPDTLKRIFDPFFTTKDLGRGTGLGLASVQGIIKNHNGWIVVSSKKGSGTTFRVFFPSA